jgi:hypothetical protein
MAPQAFAQSKEQINAAKKLQADVMKKHGLRTTDALPDFIKNLKGIKIGSDTEDDVVAAIGEPSSKSVLFGKKVWSYAFISEGNNMNSVGCRIHYDLNQKVAFIELTKSGTGGVEMIYTQGTSPYGGNAISSDGSGEKSTLNQVKVETNAPASPTEGQIYFNSTDKHFYGWNGSEWKKLD